MNFRVMVWKKAGRNQKMSVFRAPQTPIPLIVSELSRGKPDRILFQEFRCFFVKYCNRFVVTTSSCFCLMPDIGAEIGGEKISSHTPHEWQGDDAAGIQYGRVVVSLFRKTTIHAPLAIVYTISKMNMNDFMASMKFFQKVCVYLPTN